jgi:hypothetical protein
MRIPPNLSVLSSQFSVISFKVVHLPPGVTTDPSDQASEHSFDFSDLLVESPGFSPPKESEVLGQKQIILKFGGRAYGHVQVTREFPPSTTATSFRDI